MNRELIEAVQNSISEVSFNQYEWGWHRHGCKTPCCLAGMALILDPPTEAERVAIEAQEMTVADAAQKRLQFPESVASEVYEAVWPKRFHTHPERWKIDIYFSPSAHEASAFLDRVLQGEFGE